MHRRIEHSAIDEKKLVLQKFTLKPCLYLELLMHVGPRGSRDSWKGDTGTLHERTQDLAKREFGRIYAHRGGPDRMSLSMTDTCARD